MNVKKLLSTSKWMSSLFSKKWVGSKKFKKLEFKRFLKWLPLYGSVNEVYGRTIGKMNNYDFMCKVLKFTKKEMREKIKKVEPGQQQLILLHELRTTIHDKYDHINKGFRAIKICTRPTIRIDIFIGGWHGIVVKRETDGKIIELIG